MAPFATFLSYTARSLPGMSLASNRPASELPGDPSRFHFFYSHGHPAQSWDYEDTLECWHVQVTYGLSTDEDWDGQESTDDDAGTAEPTPGSDIGEVILYRLRTHTGQNRWEAADAHSGDLEVIAHSVLAEDGHDYNDAFDRAVESFGDLLILDRVRLDKAWRGFGFGPYCAAEAIRRLSSGCCAVAAYPAMSEYSANRDEVTEAFREEAKRKIAALWESIGFHPFQDGVWLLDTALKEPEDRLEECRAELEALSEAYQAHRSEQSETSVEPSPDPESTPATADSQGALASAGEP